MRLVCVYLDSLHLGYKDVIQFKEDDPECKDVHLLVVHCSHHLLRAHVKMCAYVASVGRVATQRLQCWRRGERFSEN